MSPRTHRFSALLLLSLVGCAAAPQPIETATARRRFDVAPVHAGLRALDVYAYHGSVTVETAAQFSCQAIVDIAAPTQAQADAIASELELSPDEDSGRLSLAIEPPIGACIDDIHASYRLRVPAAVAIRIVTLDGSVALRAFGGIASVRTGSGRIRAQMLDGGACELTTKNGPIELFGEYKSAVINTAVGNIICVPPVSHGRLAVGCADGDITLHVGPDDAIRFAFDTETGSFHSGLSVDLIEGRVGRRRIYSGGRGDAGLYAHAEITSVSAPLRIVPRRTTN